jgi:hypothetical protein
MCKWRICFKIGNRTICICIPLLIDPFWRFKLPEPEPFLFHPDFDLESIKHLQVLVTIDRFAAELPAEFARDIQKSVGASLRTLTQKLGEGVELSQHAEKG